MHETSLARLRFKKLGIGELELTYGFQVNDRDEFDIIRGESTRPSLMFLLRSHTVDISLTRTPLILASGARIEGMAGVSGMLQENVFRGVPLLSDYRSLSGGVFVLERLVLTNVEIEAGVRYDHETRDAYIPKKTSSKPSPRRSNRSRTMWAAGELVTLWLYFSCWHGIARRPCSDV